MPDNLDMFEPERLSAEQANRRRREHLLTMARNNAGAAVESLRSAGNERLTIEAERLQVNIAIAINRIIEGR